MGEDDRSGDVALQVLGSSSFFSPFSSTVIFGEQEKDRMLAFE